MTFMLLCLLHLNRWMGMLWHEVEQQFRLEDVAAISQMY
jgi:hypothetical protein